MASQQSTVDFIIDQIGSAGAVSAKKMFGEYGIYCDGKMVALVCDDQLYIKPTAPGRRYLGHVTEQAPYPSAKPYFLISGERWDQGDWLAELIRVSAAALPRPSKKRACAGRPPVAAETGGGMVEPRGAAENCLVDLTP